MLCPDYGQPNQDAWVTEQVNAAFARLERGEEPLVSNDSINRPMAAKKAAYRIVFRVGLCLVIPEVSMNGFYKMTDCLDEIIIVKIMHQK